MSFYLKTNKLNIRPAFQNEREEFEYQIRNQWQEEYGYEVEFEWFSKKDVPWSKRGFWGIKLNGDVMGAVLRETNSGQFIAEFDGSLEGTEDEVIGNLELLFGYFTDEDQPDWDYCDENPRNVDPKRLEIVLNPRAKVLAVTAWLRDNNGILIAEDYEPETAFQLKGENPPCTLVTRKQAAEAIKIFYTPAQGGVLKVNDGAGFGGSFSLQYELSGDEIFDEIATAIAVEYFPRTAAAVA